MIFLKFLFTAYVLHASRYLAARRRFPVLVSRSGIAEETGWSFNSRAFGALHCYYSDKLAMGNLTAGDDEGF